MKKTICTAKLIVFLLLLMSVAAYASGLTRITGPELEKMMKDGSPIVIVDVREPELYARGHIPGAMNIPYEDGAHKRILKELKPSDRVVFVCHGGPMGDELGEILVNNRYPKVYNLIGGMIKWRGAYSVR